MVRALSSIGSVHSSEFLFTSRFLQKALLMAGFGEALESSPSPVSNGVIFRFAQSLCASASIQIFVDPAYTPAPYSEYIITLNAEIKHYWPPRNRFNLISFLFFFNRYFALLAYIPFVATTTLTVGQETVSLTLTFSSFHPFRPMAVIRLDEGILDAYTLHFYAPYCAVHHLRYRPDMSPNHAVSRVLCDPRRARRLR